MKDYLLKCFPRLLAVLGCSTLVTACYGTPYDSYDAMITGTVLDAETDRPVPGISVRITAGYRSQGSGNTIQSLVPTDDVRESLTDYNGRFQEYIHSYREPDGIIFECLDVDGEENGAYSPKSQVYQITEINDVKISLDKIQD